MQSVWDEAVRILAGGGTFVLAAVVAKSGSAPAAPGAVMLVTADGGTVGTVGGGVLEAAASAAAKRLPASGGCDMLHFDLGGAEAAAQGMVCGGTAEVFLDMAGRRDLPAFTAARECADSGKRGFLLYRRDVSPRTVEFTEQSGEDGDGVVRVPLHGRGGLFIFGCGHVGAEAARLAGRVDFNVVAVDDRREFANPERFPGATPLVVESFEALPALGIGADSFVVIATRGHLHDLAVLDQMLRAGAGYIGMIGSRKKRDITRARLVELGHPADCLDRVHSPIGLDIGSETPAEIAVSIVAELIRERAGRREKA